MFNKKVESTLRVKKKKTKMHLLQKLKIKNNFAKFCFSIVVPTIIKVNVIFPFLLPKKIKIIIIEM
jgi:hypothetical protein